MCPARAVRPAPSAEVCPARAVAKGGQARTCPYMGAVGTAASGQWSSIGRGRDRLRAAGVDAGTGSGPPARATSAAGDGVRTGWPGQRSRGGGGRDRRGEGDRSAVRRSGAIFAGRGRVVGVVGTASPGEGSSESVAPGRFYRAGGRGGQRAGGFGRAERRPAARRRDCSGPGRGRAVGGGGGRPRRAGGRSAGGFGRAGRGVDRRRGRPGRRPDGQNAPRGRRAAAGGRSASVAVGERGRWSGRQRAVGWLWRARGYKSHHASRPPSVSRASRQP